MNKEKASLITVLDSRRKKANGKYPIKLRVTFQRKRKYYGMGYEVNQKEWEIMNDVHVRGRLREVKQDLVNIEEEAQKCASKIIPFSFNHFENEFFDKVLTFQSLSTAYDAYIDDLRKNDQYGTALSYRTAINSLLKFKPTLSFEDITVDFLIDFEKWMLKKSNSITSVGIYLRTLRAIMNMAKENGIISPEDYPFGRRKYVIPTGKNIKKALSIEDVKKIFNYSAARGSAPERSRDFWIFSYLCNGINFKDIALLKWSNLTNEKICFERAKTIRTKRGNPLKIVAVRNAYIDDIIRKWGSTDREPNEYLFDIITIKDPPEKARKKIQQFTKVTNTYLKQIGQELELSLKLTTYVARHSFATILVRGGAPLEMASQALGHSNLTTTQKYFAGFDLDKQSEFTKALTNF